MPEEPPPLPQCRGAAMQDAVSKIIGYHEASKHNFRRFARGPEHLDWASQPNPFRRYHDAPFIPLGHFPLDDSPPYEDALTPGCIPPAPLTFDNLSRLLLDSLALSAWKRAGGETWALRVNPSSGNLHPTEGYVLCRPLKGLAETATVCHYAPREHGLEIRAVLPPEVWKDLITGFPEETVFVALTSIHWREAWKYGERAYRYCQHDVGHAIAAVAAAAAGLGWRARLLDHWSTEALTALLGLCDAHNAEPEAPDCLLALSGENLRAVEPPNPAPPLLRALSRLEWKGRPNRLSSSHVKWPAIDDAADATLKPVTKPQLKEASFYMDTSAVSAVEAPPARRLTLRRIVRQRRSAVAMDGVTYMPRSAFIRTLHRLMPGPGNIPFATITWPPQVHLLLFVHRVRSLARGLYFLCRNDAHTTALKGAFRSAFQWTRPADCPSTVNLFLLQEGDAREAAAQLACWQEIAGDGCFSAAMIAAFEEPLIDHGPWFYPRLHWECGLIGQMLYLEAEAEGFRGTGIGCFFDDPTHEVLGLSGLAFQDLYHFTVGGPVEDTRLTTFPAYPSSEISDS